MNRIFALLLILSLTSCGITGRIVFNRGGRYHYVRAGETLWRISQIYRVSVDTIKSVNHIKDVTKIQTGQRLYIPYHDRNIVYNKPKAKSKIKTVKKKTNISKKVKKTTLPDNIKLIWPIKGTITSKFGPRDDEFHQGIDIAASKGTPIKAAFEGKVIFSEVMRGYGNVVMIENSSEVITVYAHNKKNIVKYGDYVKQGDKIAYVGRTGRATGPHLHFEIRIQGEPVDPLKYLP